MIQSSIHKFQHNSNNATIKEVGAKGRVLILGVKGEGDEDEDEDYEEEEDPNIVYTKEQMESLRVILGTPRRIAEVDKARKVVTGGQGGGFMMFNTENGNQIIFAILRWLKAVKAKKTLPEKFDSLFALTHQLLDIDMWAMDNELHGPGGKPSPYCHI